MSSLSTEYHLSFFPWLCLFVSSPGQTWLPYEENFVCRQEVYCSEVVEVPQGDWPVWRTLGDYLLHHQDVLMRA